MGTEVTNTAGGGRTSPILRYLLLLVLVFAVVEFIYGGILEAQFSKVIQHTQSDSSSTIETNGTVELSKVSQNSHDNRKTNFEFKNNTNNSTNNTKNVFNVRAENRTSFSNNFPIIDSESKKKHHTKFPNIENDSKDSVRSKKRFRSANKNKTHVLLCDEFPPALGVFSKYAIRPIKLTEIETKYPKVQAGGLFTPQNCTARHKVAIIVPYRNREKHLATFLNHMHPFLMKQQLEYGIFIVEQVGTLLFNRAKLMNVGFVESQRLKEGGWQCFIFHDVDLLPLNLRNIYSCPKQPRHMSTSISSLGFQLPFNHLFGGVVSMTLPQFTKLNGFSNKFWGWGGEDNDMYIRLKMRDYHLSRFGMSIGRYEMLTHEKSSPNPKRYEILSQTAKNFLDDGISTLTYKLVKVTKNHLFTHILVNIDEIGAPTSGGVHVRNQSFYLPFCLTCIYFFVIKL